MLRSFPASLMFFYEVSVLITLFSGCCKPQVQVISKRQTSDTVSLCIFFCGVGLCIRIKDF